MSYLNQLKNAMPVAPLKLMVLKSAEELGNKVNNYLVDFRSKVNNVYILTSAKICQIVYEFFLLCTII